MEKVNEAINADSSTSLGFLKYVFNFDEENKNSMMNMIQMHALHVERKPQMRALSTLVQVAVQ